MQDSEFASGWRRRKILKCLKNKRTLELVCFIEARHRERFFRPIKELNSASGNLQGYGFGSMAICCLLIETIQSYRDGLPTTDGRELSRLRNLKQTPSRYVLPANLKVRGQKTFERFFHHYHSLFPGISAVSFYKNVRCGLLHQGQTKHRWTVRAFGSGVADSARRIIHRNSFSDALESAFQRYLDELRTRSWKDATWVKASRKIWWLIRTS